MPQPPRQRPVAGVWWVVLVVAALLTADTLILLFRVGLTGPRPPLSAFETSLRIILIFGALGLLLWRPHVLERVTLIVAAAAAGSSAAHGFGLRSPALSAFRLLSHLAAYVLVMAVAVRLIAIARPQRS